MQFEKQILYVFKSQYFKTQFQMIDFLRFSLKPHFLSMKL
jgi:hypothetical protein